MASTTFSGPIKSGPKVATGEQSAKGDVVLTQEYSLDPTAVTSGVGFDAFRLPANSSLVDVEALIVVASDSATSAVIDVTDGSNDIVTGLDAKTAANSIISASNGDGTIADMSLFLAPAPSADTNLQIVYTENGAATVGDIRVRIRYIQGE